MAIRVICPGCMTSFEVDDRFAGKKGPCPKCGHIIEIPKEKLIIHAPDTITDGGKTKAAAHTGHDARPIAAKRIIYTGKQIFWGVMGALGAMALTYLVGASGLTLAAKIYGAIAVFLIAFPIAEFGYTLIRDENDLEMFLGNERHWRSFYTALVFGASWLVFEAFAYYLNATGPMTCLYLLVCGAIGAIGALIFFDCNYGKALLVYALFAVAAIVGRGLLFEHGWIWQSNVAASRAPANVDLGPARMNGATKSQSAEQIVENKRAIQETADERKAAAKKKNAGTASSSAEDADEAQPKPRLRRGRRR
ncbi:MAG: hypothetical protein IKX88_08595 [Thermoguttaceae bacterium]|nr:hypothetical protein [Thermoguttaceae bacterium]